MRFPERDTRDCGGSVVAIYGFDDMNEFPIDVRLGMPAAAHASFAGRAGGVVHGKSHAVIRQLAKQIVPRRQCVAAHAKVHKAGCAKKIGVALESGYLAPRDEQHLVEERLKLAHLAELRNGVVVGDREKI